MADMGSSRRIGVIGGSGFIGQALIRQLGAAGKQIYVYSRHPERHRDLGLLPGVVVHPLAFDQPAQWPGALQGCDAVINLVGILHDQPHPGRSFDAVHAALPHDLAACAKEVGARRFLHMSALNADAQQGTSRYLRSKGTGEDSVHQLADANFTVTSFRPSVVFGPGDSFILMFARLLRLAPGLFPAPCPNARLAPVYVEDVARAFVASLDDPATFGQRYDLCGPQVYTLRELLVYLAEQQKLHRVIWGLSDTLSRRQAQLLEYVPGSPFRYDNYLSLQATATCRPEHDYFTRFGVRPAALSHHIRQLLGIARPRPSTQQS